ncbi:MAG TPA: hypothetical protein VK153_00505 [Candidatus Paceibacterota bacterium]|nr:hypothetical protein [Candidatus Paceibacterota bacterium]
MENIIRRTISDLGLVRIMLLVIGGISLLFWASFVFTFCANIVYGGPRTDLVRWGIDLLRNNLVFSLISFVFAGIAVYIAIQIENGKK